MHPEKVTGTPEITLYWMLDKFSDPPEEEYPRIKITSKKKSFFDLVVTR